MVLHTAAPSPGPRTVGIAATACPEVQARAGHRDDDASKGLAAKGCVTLAMTRNPAPTREPGTAQGTGVCVQTQAHGWKIWARAPAMGFCKDPAPA
jgi:hypothetical protein